MESNGETCNHCDILVGTTHYLRDHIVFQKQWSKNHASSDSRASTEQGGNEASYGHLRNICEGIESRVIFIPLVLVSILDLMDSLKSFCAVVGQKQHECCKEEDQPLFALSSEVEIITLFFAVEKLRNKQDAKVENYEKAPLYSKMGCLLDFDGLELWSHMLRHEHTLSTNRT